MQARSAKQQAKDDEWENDMFDILYRSCDAVVNT
jgi:hypothetical protein